MNNQDKVVIGAIDWEILRRLIVGRLKNEVLFSYVQQRYLDGLLTVAERNWVICLLYQLGSGSVSYEEVGECFGGIERERVRQILQRSGFSRIERFTQREKASQWLKDFVVSQDARERIEAIMAKAAGSKRYWVSSINGHDSQVGRLREKEVLTALGMPIADDHSCWFAWSVLMNLGLVEEIRLTGVVLRYGLKWDLIRCMEFFRINYFEAEGATLGDVLVKINALARRKRVLTVGSSQSLANYLKEKGKRAKNRGCKDPVWLHQ